jgi:3-deoxy-D-arabino-heptulosonate 7-phosphate (DAHP) synthase
MKVQICKQVTLAGQIVRLGEVVEASQTDATILISSGCAIEAPELVQEKAKEVAVDNPPPKPKTSRRRIKSS